MEPTEQPPAAPSGRPPDPGGPVLSRRGLITATGAALAAAAGAGAVLTGRPGTPPSRTGGVDAAAFASPPAPAVDVPGRLARRRLGRLAWDGSILSLGAAYLDGPETVAAALDAGMNVIDTAPSSVYGASHEILAQVVPSRRDEVMLMSKVDGRTRDRADLNLRDSLERLRVDHLDVLMLHGLSYPDEVDQVFAPGGAMQTLLALREQAWPGTSASPHTGPAQSPSKRCGDTTSTWCWHRSTRPTTSSTTSPPPCCRSLATAAPR
jgi:hypothetical protein